jgi:hypothetical protein
MATTKTRQELVNKALSDLGVLPAGAIASATDYADMDGYVDGLIEKLARRNIVYIDDADEIPIEYFAAVAVFLANEAAPEFGAAGVDTRQAEIDLRQLTQSDPSYDVLGVDYF